MLRRVLRDDSAKNHSVGREESVEMKKRLAQETED